MDHKEEKTMRMKKLLSLSVILICMSFMLTACGKDKNAGHDLRDDETLSQAPHKEEPEPYDKDKQGDPDGADEKDDKEQSDNKDRELKRNNARARRAYDDFFADEELAVSDIDAEGRLRKGNRYSFSEIIDIYIKNESQNLGPGDEQVRLKDATYAYIDCGADGSTELVVNLNYMIYGETNCVYFFRYDDGAVHLIGEDEWGYRSFMTVNKYGYVNNGGSGGANLHVDEYYYFDKDCNKIYLYSEEMLMGMDSPRVQKVYIKGGYDRDDYPDDSYETGGYTVYTVNFKDYEYDEDMTEDDIYERYYKDQIYCFESEDGRPVKPDEYMTGFYKKEGIRWYLRDEFDEIIAEHLNEMGADETIRDGAEAEWESIVDLGVMKHEVENTEDTEGSESYPAASYVIKDDHQKPYINPDNPYKDHEYNAITLKQKSCKENEITDTAEWFARAGTSESGTFFYDDKYNYILNGDAGYGTMTNIEIYDRSTGKWLYDFDFSDFLYEKGYENKDYVDRGIRNCFITDDLLYLNIGHRTYAQDCPVNAFMICVNVDSGEVMWISQPLTSNSDDFARYGDNMITGYGFTAEDDFIYILNRYTGEITDKIKVKKSPDHFAFVDNDLWVRTYSYDYEFSIIDKK